MIVLSALLAAAAVGIAGLLKGPLNKSMPQALRVANYRGEKIPVSGGLLLMATFVAVDCVLAAVAVVSPTSLKGDISFEPAAIPATFLSADNFGMVVIVLGFALLGLFDDVAGPGGRKGFSGHLSALREGAVTPGVLKALGGAFIGFLAGALWERDLLGALIDGALVALSANFINLLDLRPGRAAKGFILIWLAPLIAAWGEPFMPLSTVIAATVIVWLPVELDEKGMLGDSGANLLGAVLGCGLALTFGTGAKSLLVIALLGLTLLSERFSYSSAIERVPPLRWLDSLGRRAEP